MLPGSVKRCLLVEQSACKTGPQFVRAVDTVACIATANSAVGTDAADLGWDPELIDYYET
ncbi:hypothetical protein GCM10011352_38730 [Marinobacterium zhoushanense]|uniref:Uncharacterized protein n=1 Tax=Marinobacterium zhoushanense TaxID=1679163 RepID=A0ABQ1KU92_9GAMM|nr:hypothetical protein GCM10011352_38730 [Marinobacterium zhoushanense]